MFFFLSSKVLEYRECWRICCGQKQKRSGNRRKV